MQTIYQFDGEHRFLSNFYFARFWWAGFLWDYSENAYQAAKSLKHENWVLLSGASVTPGQAKRIGKSLAMRQDWEQIKQDTMLAIVKEKFYQNPDLEAKLMATAPARLEEGNTWGDKVWGISPPASGNGTNWLGEILMLVRDNNGNPR